MNNKYINSFIFLLLVISLVVINFNQEDELSVTEEENEPLEVVEKSTTSKSKVTTKSLTKPVTKSPKKQTLPKLVPVHPLYKSQFKEKMENKTDFGTGKPLAGDFEPKNRQKHYFKRENTN